MPIGQPAGPPASYRQVQQLTDLVHAAGHTDFRDARGPLGLNQRQAGGRFTGDEADALIARLETEAELRDAPETGDGLGGSPEPEPAPRFNRSQAEQINRLHEVPGALLAAELQRRGWIVMEP